MSPLLQALLMGLRANCEATICAIDTYLTLSNQAPAPAPQPVAEPGPESEDPEACQHPNLVHAPVMGNQGRFICKNPNCRAEVNK
jgi:hypothetical protein